MPFYAINGVRPTVHPDAWVAPSADLIGDVRVEVGASIWFGAVIRADNTPIVIGAGSNVQDGATLHSDPGSPCTVGAGCTIGHRAILHGCTIADGVLVGMGAIILNDATIAGGSLVGAGALVTERKSFPVRSLIVGSPARAVRTLDDAAVAAIGASAEGYARRSRGYAEALPIG